MFTIEDFDDICSRRMGTYLGALNKTVRSYAWSCAQLARA